METMVCKKCGRELPTECFGNDKTKISGKKDICKECINNGARIRNAKKHALRASSPSGLASELVKARNVVEPKKNADLERFTPRELIEELRARGYKGTLQYVYEITL